VVAKPRSRNISLILYSLMIAYCIWLTAKMRNVEEGVLDGVPVVVDLPPYVEAETSRQTVSIEVRYPKSQRKQVHSGAFHVLINDPELLKQAGIQKPNSVTIPILPDDVQHPNLPPSVQVQKVEPSRITISLKYRTVPARVVPRFAGRPAQGYRLEKTIVRPKECLLTGPQKLLDIVPRDNDAVAQLPTSPILLAGKRDSFSTSVAILLPDGLSLLDETTRKRLSREVSLAVVQVIIREEETTRTVKGVAVEVPTLSRNLVPLTQPTSGSVTVAGPRSRVEKLKPEDFTLRPKNPPEEKPGFAGEIAIEARFAETAPPEVRIVSFHPEVVLLRYQTRGGEKKTTAPLSAP